MLTRRRFLGNTTLGMLALAGGCTPPALVSVRRRDPMVPGDVPSLSAKVNRGASRKLVLGYPINMAMPSADFFAWRQQLAEAGIGQFAYNNVGDPFSRSSLPYNTHDIERQVILRFARQYGFSPQDTWGFVSNSGTDSNLHGMYMGRTLLKARTGAMPKAYFTAEAHYSIQILQDLLGLERVLVATRADGAMDPEDLRTRLAAHADAPALVVATIGTTFKGAIDPIDRIRAVLHGHASYLHLDAALFGGYLPYTSQAAEVLHRLQSNGASRYDSIAVSCHKFFGFPAPAGLFMTSERTFREFHRHFSAVHNPEYIHHVPGTITCSRDAVKPAEFHYFSTSSAHAMLTESARGMLRRAGWLQREMELHLPHYRPIRANDLSNTVHFRCPGEAVVTKYSLATMWQDLAGQKQHCAHVVVMPHATEDVLREFVADLHNDSPATA